MLFKVSAVSAGRACMCQGRRDAQHSLNYSRLTPCYGASMNPAASGYLLFSAAQICLRKPPFNRGKRRKHEAAHAVCSTAPHVRYLSSLEQCCTPCGPAHVRPSQSHARHGYHGAQLQCAHTAQCWLLECAAMKAPGALARPPVHLNPQMIPCSDVAALFR